MLEDLRHLLCYPTCSIASALPGSQELLALVAEGPGGAGLGATWYILKEGTLRPHVTCLPGMGPGNGMRHTVCAPSKASS